MARFSSSSVIFLSFMAFLMRVIAIAADVAHSGAVVFEEFVQVLDHVFAAFFGQRRHRHADNLAIVHGVQAEVGGTNGFFNRSQSRGIEGLNGDELRFRGVDLGNLVERHL